jgi:hypothetical protein
MFMRVSPCFIVLELDIKSLPRGARARESARWTSLSTPIPIWTEGQRIDNLDADSEVVDRKPERAEEPGAIFEDPETFFPRILADRIIGMISASGGTYHFNLMHG